MCRVKQAPRPLAAPVSALVILLVALLGLRAGAFRLSFGHRLFKSLQQHSNPQLNPPDTLIRPIECRNANNHSEAGICMFSIDCMQNKGVPLSICKHNYFVGTCCRLPDYNNFVGIVYDLRETESANQQLNARRGAQPQLDASGATTPKPTRLVAGAASQTQRQEAEGANSTATATATMAAPLAQASGAGNAAPAQSDSSTTTSHLERSSTAGLAEEHEAGQETTRMPVQAAERLQLDEKYVISSTRLFPTSVASTSAKPASQLQNAPAANIETARNADGPHQQASAQTTSEIIRQLAGELAQNQPLLAQATQNDDLKQQQVAANAGAYELLLANKSGGHSAVPASLNGLDIALVSSAHAPPNRPSVQQQQQQQQNNVYLLTDDSGEAQKGLPTSSIVFSSNHQPAPSAEVRHQAQQPSPPPASEQEFALSTTSANHEAPASSVSALIFASSTPAAPSAPSASQTPGPAAGASTDSPPSSEPQTISPIQQVNSSEPQAASPPEPTASTHVDLVSYSPTAQTTTPFTSSLSTALLPNISSHPYAPTTLAPSTPSPTQPAQQVLVSNPSASNDEQQQHASQATPPTPAHESSAPPSASPLFYSTSPHAASLGPSRHEAGAETGQHVPAHSSRPAGSAGLQAASKIVTGNSATNNLIPGLSGLQSAILAHIPFKIASGLSSGLSTYLQAAMKPTLGGRPLISSNTAPALQYQQQQANSSSASPQVQASKPSPSSPALVAHASGQPGAIRFPAPSSGSSSSPSSSSTVASTIAERDVLREAQLVCGRPQVGPNEASKKRVARIVGGNQSSFGQWPWMVSLRQWRKGAFLHKCGAALLNENWAITAAHCVENVKAPDLLLRLGEFDVSNQNEPYPYTERRVKAVVSHSSFDPKTFEYDLALIKFTEPIQYERNILPVCVPTGNDSYVDRMATVIGWGRLYEDGPLPDVIQHVDVPIITNNECEKMYKNAGFVEEIPEMFICAGISKGGRDSCEGDSGGPLTMIDHDGRSYLVGIISWGIGCALPSQPGVYTRITAFSPWINSIIST